jgi:hypothetical protein
MATHATTPLAQGDVEPSNETPIRVDYRARAAIRQLSAEDQAAVEATIAMLTRQGLAALAKVGHVRHVIGLSGTHGHGPVYELRVPGARDLRIFFIRSEGEEGENLVVTDVLRRRALRNAAQSF